MRPEMLISARPARREARAEPDGCMTSKKLTMFTRARALPPAAAGSLLAEKNTPAVRQFDRERLPDPAQTSRKCAAAWRHRTQ